MLANMIPNYDQEIQHLRLWGPEGFTLAFNLTYRGPEHLHTELPEAWRDLYEEQSYFSVDPVLVWTLRNTGARRWSEIKLPDIHEVMVAARRFRLSYGGIFSTTRGKKRSLLSVARADRELTDTEMEVIQARFESWVDMVVGMPELTPREIDVLCGLKDGLCQQEIAERLGVSESAIKQRCMKACLKLNARTRTQAVAIAVSRNLFDH